MSFELIPEAIQTGLVDAGLVIHEAQIAYDKSKFDKVLDSDLGGTLKLMDYLFLLESI